jgi:hypothetical protein
MKPKIISLAGVLAVLCWSLAGVYWLFAVGMGIVHWPTWPATALTVAGFACLVLWLLGSLWWAAVRAAVSARLRANRPAPTEGELLCDECRVRLPVVRCIMHGQRLCVTCLQWHYEDLECRIAPLARPGITRPAGAPAARAQNGGRP